MSLEKTEQIHSLLDTYAPLLRERQLELLSLYFDEDYSLAEIAEIYGISRQAVHDGLQRSVRSLEIYEQKLGFLAQRQGMERCRSTLLAFLEKATSVFKDNSFDEQVLMIEECLAALGESGKPKE